MTAADRLDALADRFGALVEDLAIQLDALRDMSPGVPVEEHEFMTIAELVEMLSVGERTLRRLRARRGFPRPVKGPGKLRWRRADLVRWMERGR